MPCCCHFVSSITLNRDPTNFMSSYAWQNPMNCKIVANPNAALKNMSMWIFWPVISLDLKLFLYKIDNHLSYRSISSYENCSNNLNCASSCSSKEYEFCKTLLFSISSYCWVVVNLYLQDIIVGYHCFLFCWISLFFVIIGVFDILQKGASNPCPVQEICHYFKW